MVVFRRLLEELHMSFFAPELRTPQPVSIKRLVKAWGQLNYCVIGLNKLSWFMGIRHHWKLAWFDRSRNSFSTLVAKTEEV
jgi:hypothetical protein